MHLLGEVLMLRVERLLEVLGMSHLRRGFGTRLDNLRSREAATNLVEVFRKLSDRKTLRQLQ